MDQNQTPEHIIYFVVQKNNILFQGISIEQRLYFQAQPSGHVASSSL